MSITEFDNPAISNCSWLPLILNIYLSLNIHLRLASLG